MKILGIDPGQHCGLAYYNAGELCETATVAPHQLPGAILDFWNANAVPKNTADHNPIIVFEDSRLQSHVWVADAYGKQKAHKIARNVGMVDMVCAIIAGLCVEHNLKHFAMSPRAKGAKINAEQFALITCYTGHTNQHERDAAMVAWPYRMMRSGGVR